MHRLLRGLHSNLASAIPEAHRAMLARRAELLAEIAELDAALTLTDALARAGQFGLGGTDIHLMDATAADDGIAA